MSVLGRLWSIAQANLTLARALLATVALLWAGLLLSTPARAAMTWPLWTTRTWGYIWLLYGLLKGVQLWDIPLSLGYRLAINCFGVLVISSWVYGYLSVGQFAPAPIAFLLLAILMLVRTRR